MIRAKGYTVFLDEKSKMKNELAYSELTKKIYWVDGKGVKKEVTQNFIQVALLWLSEGRNMKQGDKSNLYLDNNGQTDYEIRLTKVSKDKCKHDFVFVGVVGDEICTKCREWAGIDKDRASFMRYS